MARSIPGSVFSVVLSILTLGCAITILSINRYQLTNWYFTACSNSLWFPVWGYSCVTYYSCLWNKYGTSDLCSYTYAVGSVSLLVSALTACCQLSGGVMVKIMGDIWLSIFGFIWWIVAAAIFTSNYNIANNDGVPQKNWRCGIMAVCWAATGLYFIWIFLSVFLCLSVRKAAQKYERDERQERHQEMAHAPQPVYNNPPPPQPQYPVQYAPPQYPPPTNVQPGYPPPQAYLPPQQGYPAPQDPYGAAAPYSVPPPNKY